MAPGQPHTRPNMMSVLSDTLQRFALAADLSMAYTTKHTKLAAKYRPATHFGTFQATEATTYTARNIGMVK